MSRFIACLLVTAAGGGRRAASRLEHDLLRAPRGDLRDEQLIGIAAVDLVNRAELAEPLAGLAELADDRAVELHLVDLAGDRPRRRRVAVGVRVRRRTDTDAAPARCRPPTGCRRCRSWPCSVRSLSSTCTRRVAAIADVDVALRVGRDRVRRVQLARRRAARRRRPTAMNRPFLSYFTTRELT